MLIDELIKKKAIKDYPGFLPESIDYLTIMGSQAYGVATGSSDIDLYGFCTPPINVVFPHLDGCIPGFDNYSLKFEQFQAHGVKVGDSGMEYDISIFSIPKFFKLLADNNPNIVDSIFTRDEELLYTSVVGRMVRTNRRMFLHKGAFQKFKGYAYSQIAKLRNKNPDPGSKRFSDHQKYGYDPKFLYHAVRLYEECEQVLTTGDIDLKKSADLLLEVRQGGWSFDQIDAYVESRNKDLDEIYNNSDLQERPPMKKIKKLLIECLDWHYGDLFKSCGFKYDSLTT